jgi:nuclear pore complex protein Nup98-Nup96
MLKKQISVSTVTSDGGVPFATLNMPFKFANFFDGPSTQDPATIHERLVWDLASVLFDPLYVPEDLQAIPNSVNLLRKDALSVFWQRLVDQASSRYVAMARSNEEKAIACLSGHRIADACGHLLNGKDFHLATLVALIGSNGTLRSSIREQLNEWQKSRVLSEFSQPIRAIYELFAGNACVCEGTKGAHVEDRIESFIMSKRFGLDWRQAFGLRLWYVIDASDDFTSAIHMFAQDLEQDKETARPQAWYVEQGISPLWDDQARENREDLLWGLLKLYCDPATDLEAVLRPENSQLSPLNVRLSWQLSCALRSSGACSYGEDAREKADRLTLSFATQLTSEGNWLEATFVLLHLSAPSVRAKHIQDHLAYHAGRIGPEDGPAFTTLTRDYRIPASWVWEAKALYMRSIQKDPRREVEFLLNAGAYNEAHRTFSREVAPKYVIEEEWETIRALINGFKGRESSIPEWNLGGQLYVDYLSLVESQRKGLGKVDGMVLERLLAALPAIVRTDRHPGFLERVAAQEISGALSRVMAELARHGHVSISNFIFYFLPRRGTRRRRATTNATQNKDVSRVLTLPLTEDKYLKHTVDLSFGLYKSIMAGGR